MPFGRRYNFKENLPSGETSTDFPQTLNKADLVPRDLVSGDSVMKEGRVEGSDDGSI